MDLVLTNSRHGAVTQALLHFLNELQPPAATTTPIPLLPYVPFSLEVVINSTHNGGSFSSVCQDLNKSYWSDLQYNFIDC